jgi:cytochrome P450
MPTYDPMLFHNPDGTPSLANLLCGLSYKTISRNIHHSSTVAMRLIPDFEHTGLGLFLWLAVPYVITIVLWNIISLIQNYLRVQRSQIPVYICPANPVSVAWLILGPPLQPLLRYLLPSSIFDRMIPTFYGWEFKAKWDLHAKFGRMFFLSTPGTNDLWIADSEAAIDILKRPKDFIPLPGVEIIAGIFGPNLLTSHGEQWQRQRRLIAPNFNENISDLVWTEARAQTSEMLDFFLEGQHGETDEIVSGLRQIAIHIIGVAGYGVHESWKAARIKSGERTKADMMNYVEALSSLIDHLIPATMLPSWLLSLPLMPQSVRNIGTSKQRFRVLTKQILEDERQQAETQPKERRNLMSTLVALSDSAKAHSNSLTEEQISGNLFLFTVAGYETTATSLAYGITLLAAEPKWQDWLYEEISQHQQEQTNLTDDSDYHSTFPHLTRNLAFMFETLRLYNPLVHIGRINPHPQTIQTSQGPQLIPAYTQSYINSTALHFDPLTWGTDVLTFNPTRWLDSSTDQLLPPPQKGTFLPWSFGPRICPGMKMAQVEFIGVLSTLLRRCRVEVVARRGEDVDTARRRLMDTMQDSRSVLTLSMKRPREVRLRFVRR